MDCLIFAGGIYGKYYQNHQYELHLGPAIIFAILSYSIGKATDLLGKKAAQAALIINKILPF